MTDMLSGGGEMGARMRALDWASTPFGAPETWPQSLRSAVGICLNSRFPIAIYWGSELALLYNDSWSRIPGKKHPWALGRPGREVWPEIWAEIGPLFDSVQQTGEGVWQEDQLLPMHRHGYTEECYFNFTFSPIRGEDGAVVGIFNAVVETTFRVIEERRARLLRDLNECIASAKSAVAVCERAAEALSRGPADVPFCLFYLREPDSGELRLAAQAGVTLPEVLRPPTLAPSDPEAPWPVTQALEAAQRVVIDRLDERLDAAIPSLVWPEAVERAVIMPIAGVQSTEATGLLIVGVSPRRMLDPAYHTFVERIALHVATAIGNAHAYAAERRRAEALAEIDQAKTAFFSNVSHEFRTPLTLMLGPLEDVLTHPEHLQQEDHERLDMAHRNALRLLKLVNTLLDFSRIEAGRMTATYTPTDLAAFTSGLASVFRAAIERAGLQLVVDCPPLPEPVYIDRELWEKIVFNLLSNAFKFTFEGSITVALRHSSAWVELAVRDTGTGIPAEDLPHLFERFHRVKGARGRTFEGSGIGLALVQELVKLHGGTVAVESAVSEGSTFTVRIPTGTAHLPSERIVTSTIQTPIERTPEVYIDETLRWLPTPHDSGDGTGMAQSGDPASNEPQPVAASRSPRPHILLADDNTDMRAYVQRLLSQAYEVVAVADGAAALRAAQTRPFDLVLTDVMMPELDGFGLLHALRTNPQTRDLPVILLSARAGEEAQIEGMAAGADDYLIKPFSARELLARTAAHVKLQRLRRETTAALRESEEKYRALTELSAQMVWTLSPDGEITFLSQKWHDYTGCSLEETIKRGWVAQLHPEDRESVSMEFQQHIENGEPYSAELRLQAHDGTYRWHLTRATPLKNEHGDVVRWIGVTFDIHERKEAEEALERSEQRFRRVVESRPVGMLFADMDGQITDANAALLEMLGYSHEEMIGTSWAALTPPEHADRDGQASIELVSTGSVQPYEKEYFCADGTRLPVLVAATILRTDDSFEAVCFVLNNAARKRAESRLQALQEVTARFATAQTRAEVRDVVLGDVLHALGADGCGVRVLTDQQLMLEEHILSSHMTTESIHPVATISLDTQHPAAEAARRGEAVFFEDAQACLRDYPHLAALITQHHSQANAHLPLKRGAEVFGILSLNFDQPHLWDAAERAFAQALADRASVAYERARLFEAERRSRERAERLQAVTAALNSALTPTEVYEAVLTRGMGVMERQTGPGAFGAASGSLYIFEGDELTRVGRTGTKTTLTSAYQHFPRSAPIPVAAAARTAAPVWITSSADFIQQYPHLKDQIQQLGTEGAVSIPLLFEGRVLGVLNFTFDQPHTFDTDERGFLLALADQAAQALQRTSLEAAQRAYTRRLQQLNAASLAINAASTREEVLQLITEEARTLIGAHQAVSSTTTDQNWAKAITRVSLSEKYNDWNHYQAEPTGSGIYALVCRTNTPMRMTQTELEAHPAWKGFGADAAVHPPMRGWLAVPLVARDGHNLGLIQLSDKYEGEFTADDEAMLVQLAQIAAVALENQTLYEQEQQARTQAEEANRLKDEFLATVSHELRTPLTSFLGYTQLLQTRKRDEAYVARTVEKLARSAKAQAQLIEDLLDISRIVSGKLRIDPQPIDLITVISAAFDTVRPAVAAKGLDVQMDLNPDASSIIGDSNRLQQVVWNLLSNAVKFTPHGGGIRVQLEPDDHAAHLSVSDTGQGISPAFLPYVFDRFRQADGTPQRAYGGLGLGLAIVRHLVELHGGTVHAASSGEGHGATFTVQLPLALPRTPHDDIDTTARADELTDTCPPELVGLRVLLVEDQPDILELLHEMLAPCGAVVRTCNAAQEALEVVRTWRPDVIVSDIAMPGEDGYWLIRHLRALPPAEGGTTPAVALTAYVRMEDRMRVMAEGFEQYVSKPVEPTELRSVVARLASRTDTV